jgi:pyruvate kinase
MAVTAHGRRTKIIATLGPATDDPTVLDALLAAGVDVCRVNLSHGPIESSLARVAQVREAAARAKRYIAVLCDLPGPKIRTALFAGEGVDVAPGHRLQLVEAGPDGPDASDGSVIAICLDGAVRLLRPGDIVSLGDGGVDLFVVEAGEKSATAEVRSGGTLRGRPGVGLPADRVPLASPTDDDLVMLEHLLEVGVEYVAVSFVQTAADVRRVQKAAGPDGPLIIAKVETQAAVDDLEAIVEASDGVMVARGDLGVRVPLEDVPHIQRRLIRVGVSYAKPVITATQMLESMITAPTPTRAEVTDVANAVSQGTTAVMLSAETAVGHDPVAVVAAMAKIVVRAEQEFDHVAWGLRLGRQQQNSAGELPAATKITTAMTAAAWQASIDVEPAAIIACTRSGWTAKAISRFRPKCQLVGVTPSERTARQLALVWGVTPICVAELATSDELVWVAVEATVAAGYVSPGDIVAVLAGSPKEDVPTTDVLRLVHLR